MESEISELIGINADHFIILMNEWMNGRRQQHGNKQIPFHYWNAGCLCNRKPSTRTCRPLTAIINANMVLILM
jgi:hypothetical protein